VHEFAHTVLYRDGAAVGEQLLELTVEVAVLGAEDLLDALVEVLRHLARPIGELGIQLGGRLLELRLDELGVRPGLLAVEHARADLDRVADGLGRVLAVLLALANDAHRAVVVDDQAVDRDHVAEYADVGLPQWSGCFHVD
jgi:hypothetical protein